MHPLARNFHRASCMATASIEQPDASNGWADVLAIGFGTTVSMWAVGYVCRLPPAIVPSWLLLVLLLACMLAGGFIAGRRTSGGWRRSLAACLLASVLNLLILGGLLSGSASGGTAPSALWWVPSFLAVSAILGCVGGAAGQAFRAGQAPAECNWIGAWAKVLVAATLLLLIIGGMVTGYEAGLSVVDWPNSFGYNMFLYPLSRMTGGVYYEHSHRLFGSLVGLTTLTLAVYLQKNETRAWLRRFVWLALATVIAQGILGGLRVTGRFTLSTSPADTAPSIVLAIVHGTLGQIFFAMTVSIAVFTSTSWKTGPPQHEQITHPSASTDRALHAILVSLLIVQLVLGAILRHIAGGLFIHITMAVIVILVAVSAGARAWGIYTGLPLLRRLGRLLLLLAGVQVVLGITAYIAAGATAGIQPRPAADVILTTAHQATGALVLVVATMLMLWGRRLLIPATARPATTT